MKSLLITICSLFTATLGSAYGIDPIDSYRVSPDATLTPEQYFLYYETVTQYCQNWFALDSSFTWGMQQVNQNAVVPNTVSRTQRLTNIDSWTANLKNCVYQLNDLLQDRNGTLIAAKALVNSTITTTPNRFPSTITNPTAMNLRQQTACSDLLKVTAELQKSILLWVDWEEWRLNPVTSNIFELIVLLDTLNSGTRAAIASNNAYFMVAIYAQYLRDIVPNKTTFVNRLPVRTSFANITRTINKLGNLINQKDRLIGNVTAMRNNPRFK